jgi:hypothetical protein
VSWEGSTGIVTRLFDGQLRLIPGKVREFSLDPSFQTDSGIHPASYPMDTRAHFPGVKLSGHEAEHSSPSNAKVKCMELLPPLPQ